MFNTELIPDKNIVRVALIPDGYNGDTAVVGLYFDRGYAMYVTKEGWLFRANERTYAHVEELIYYYDNHRSWHFRPVIKDLTYLLQPA